MTRREIIENAFENIMAEMNALPDDEARGAVFICLADESSEWTEAAYECLVSPRAKDPKR